MKKSKNKNAFMTEVFFKILLALLIFIPTILWASKLFVASSHSADSFNDFTGYVNNLAKDPSYTQDSASLYMDEGTFILFANKGVKYIKAKESEMSGINAGEDIDIYINTPEDCIDSSCICLCKEYDEGERKIGIPNKEDYPDSLNEKKTYLEPVCHKMVCRKTDTEFISPLDVNRQVSLTEKGTGFILSREKVQSRVRTAYIEQYQDQINICFEEPCITSAMKAYMDRDNLLDRLAEIFEKCRKDEKDRCACGTVRRFELSPVDMLYDIRLEYKDANSMDAVLVRLSDNKEMDRKIISNVKCEYDFDTHKVSGDKPQDSAVSLRDKSYLFENRDIDNDGISNEIDKDDDNDNIPDISDNDDDGDGYREFIEFEGEEIIVGTKSNEIDTDSLLFYKYNKTHICIGRSSDSKSWALEWQDNKQFVINKAPEPFC